MSFVIGEEIAWIAKSPLIRPPASPSPELKGPENSITTKTDPKATLDVAGKTMNFLLDMKTTYSILNSFSNILSPNTCQIFVDKRQSKGFRGGVMTRLQRSH